jgi:hypothetical protein
MRKKSYVEGVVCTHTYIYRSRFGTVKGKVGFQRAIPCREGVACGLANRQAYCQVAKASSAHIQAISTPRLKQTYRRYLGQLGILLPEECPRNRMLRPRRHNITLVIHYNQQVPDIGARVEEGP